MLEKKTNELIDEAKGLMDFCVKQWMQTTLLRFRSVSVSLTPRVS